MRLAAFTFTGLGRLTRDETFVKVGLKYIHLAYAGKIPSVDEYRAPDRTKRAKALAAFTAGRLANK